MKKLLILWLLCGWLSPLFAEVWQKSLPDDVELRVVSAFDTKQGMMVGYRAVRAQVSNRGGIERDVNLTFGKDGRSSAGMCFNPFGRTIKVKAHSTVTTEFLIPPLYGQVMLDVSVDGEPMYSGTAMDGQSCVTNRWSYRHYGSKKHSYIFVDPAVITDRAVDFAFQHYEKGDGLERVILPLSATDFSEHWQVYLLAQKIYISWDKYNQLSPAAKEALRRYCTTGGDLVVVSERGDHQDLVPAKAPELTTGSPRWRIGQGSIRVLVVNGWRQGMTYDVFLRGEQNQLVGEILYDDTPEDDLKDLHNILPVAGRSLIPRELMMLGMVVFVLFLGPVLMWIMKSRQQLTHYLWVAPVVALVYSLLVSFTVIVSEGVTPNWQTDSVTFLDQVNQERMTIGRQGFYTSLMENELKYGAESAVVPEVRNMNYSVNCDYYRSADHQILGSGWMRSRIPLYLKTCQVTKARERLLVSLKADGTPEVTNALGGPVKVLWLTANGRLYRLDNLPAGQRRTMSCENKAYVPGFKDNKKLIETLHDKSLNFRERSLINPSHFCRENQYVAILDNANPFTEQPLDSVRETHRAWVIGTFEVEK